MTRNTANVSGIYAGVDTHKHTHHVAVIDSVGRQLGDEQFPATTVGYQALLEFITRFGPVIRIGVEGTGSYGAGLASFLRVEQLIVREIIRPNRQARRAGKSDPIDAYAAARTVAADNDLPIPKLLGGAIDGIRALLRARVSAVKAHTAAITQVKGMLITTDAAFRESVEGLSNDELVEHLAGMKPRIDEPTQLALRRLAQRIQYLELELLTAENELSYWVKETAPALVHAKGIGTISAAQLLVTAGQNPERIRSKSAFAALCGVNPIPASSGKTHRHRLNRGGDRQANAALHRITLVRMTFDARTRQYVEKKRAQGRSTREIMRCLKRYIANEVFTLITNPPGVPTTEDLRPLRQQKNLTLKTVAEHFGCWQNTISMLERGLSRNDELAQNYREYLLSA